MTTQIGSHNPHVSTVNIRCSAWFGPATTETVGIPGASDRSGYQPGGIVRVISPEYHSETGWADEGA